MALFVLSLFPFDISAGVGGFCHRTESDLLFFLLYQNVCIGIGSKCKFKVKVTLIGQLS